jgi:hypothetical protein
MARTGIELLMIVDSDPVREEVRVLEGACTRQRRATYRRSTGIRLDVKGRAGMQQARAGQGEAIRPHQ